jgi:hypothetical protein
MRWSDAALLAGALALSAGAGAPPPSASDTACDGKVVAALGQQLGIKALSGAGGRRHIVAQSCKDWPARPAIHLAAIAYDAGDEGMKSLLVAMVDKKTLRVIGSDASDVTEDSAVAFGSDSLKLDTAAYRLSPDVVAFGLRFTSAAHGPSCADYAWEDELTLFAPSGKDLHTVLHLPMHKEQALKGCLGSSTPDGVFEDAVLTIGVEPGASHGYADLSLRATIRTEQMEGESRKPPRVERQVIRYDGKRYQLGKHPPWWMETFD